nr:NADH dehydrogenase subunit 2 [Ceratocombus japonicus]
MKNNTSKMLFFICLNLGILITMFSNNWIIMWMGLEINMISFIPLLSNMNKLSSEASMMYFLIQSLGSSLLMFSIMMNPMIMFLINESLMKSMIFMSLMLKSGIPPLHSWVPEIINKMNWNQSILILTLQKVAPLTIMSNIIFNEYMINMIIILSVTTGAIGGLNYLSVRKIMTFSSINHMGWILACMKNSNQLWIFYTILYFSMTFMIMLYFKNMNMFTSNNMNIKFKTFMEKINITMMMLSLGGMPPMLGFFMKWMVIQNLIESNNMFIMIIMILMSLIILFYYLKMIFKNIANMSLTTNWKTKNNSNLMQMLFLLINSMLMMTSMIS